MLILTMPEEGTFTAPTRIELAADIADHRNGSGWEAGVLPFIEHTDIWDIIEEIALIQEGVFDGCTLTEN